MISDGRASFCILTPHVIKMMAQLVEQDPRYVVLRAQLHRILVERRRQADDEDADAKHAEQRSLFRPDCTLYPRSVAVGLLAETARPEGPGMQLVGTRTLEDPVRLRGARSLL